MSEKILVVGEFHIDRNQNRLIHGNQTVYIGPLRTSLLYYLYKNKNTVVNREDLALFVWGRSVSAHTINQHISQIRKSLATLNKLDLDLSTIPKRGYVARTESVSISFENQAPEIKQLKSTVKTIKDMEVLIVEAQATERIQLIEQLESIEVAYVEGVATAIEAERLIASRNFDLIIVDSLLAENAGIELIKRIRTEKTAASSGICVLSTHFEVLRELIGLNSLLDIQGLLLKPFEASHLKQMLMAAYKSNVILKPQVAYELVPTDALKTYELAKVVNG